MFDASLHAAMTSQQQQQRDSMKVSAEQKQQ